MVEVGETIQLCLTVCNRVTSSPLTEKKVTNIKKKPFNCIFTPTNLIIAHMCVYIYK